MGSNIRRTPNEIVKIRLNNCNSLDFQLSKENIDCLVCNFLITGDVVATFDFDSVTGMCSTVAWGDAVSFSGDICDIGLTGYDNRFVPNFTGETFNPSGDTRFCMYPVSGDIYCYSMDSVPPQTDNPQHIQFCGGFYQGFYKLHEYDYQVLPNFYKDGWTMEFWIRRNDCSLEDKCNFAYTLNDMFPNNKGIFYYWGLRAENKFCNFWSGEFGLETCTGVPLSPPYTVKPFQPPINPFLYYTKRQVRCGEDPIPTAELTGCCEGLTNNAMAFRITDDGAVGIRLLTTTGDCIITSTGVTWSGSPMIEEFYTEDGYIERDNWYHVTLRFTPYDNSQCQVYRVGNGTLDIFIDGFLKESIQNFKEFIPYALEEHRDKQLAVPYNISIGGGTQGLLEAHDFGGEDLGLPATGFTVCDYFTLMYEPQIFSGVTVDNVRHLAPDLTIQEPELIEAFLEMVIPNRIGKITVTPTTFCGRNAIKIQMNGLISKVSNIILGNGDIQNVCLQKCVKIPPHAGKCGILEEYFAGTFIGSIAEYRLHNRALCLSEIRCNYDLDKEMYGKKYYVPQCRKS